MQIAVIGFGRMGQIHAKELHQLPGAQLAAIVDPNAERQAVARSLYDCDVSANLNKPVDAVCISSPSATHFDVASHFLRQGIPCLVEKPLGMSPHEVSQLSAFAEKVPVLVGHCERYNPVVQALQKAVQNQTIKSVAAERLSHASSHIMDADVVLDLMIHDIDIVHQLLPTLTVEKAIFDGPDHCEALLRGTDGAAVQLTASRISPCRWRQVRVMTDQAFYVADLLQKRLWQRVGDTETELPVPAGQPTIAAQFHHFLDVVKGKVPPFVSAQAAARTLETAWAIQAS